MSPTAPSKPRRPRVHFTPDMQAKIAREYAGARLKDKAAIRAKYGVSTSAICRWLKDSSRASGAAIPGKRVATGLEEILWKVVIEARRAGTVTKEEARQILELVL